MPKTTKLKTKINVRLLRRIQKVMLAEPRRVAMRAWAFGTDDIKVGSSVSEESSFGLIVKRRSNIPPCGTVGCICGWGLALTTKLRGNALNRKITKLRSGDKLIPRGSMKLFGITRDQADRLFMPGDWPVEFRDKLRKYNFGTKRYAKAVCDRIDFFIKTNGTDNLPSTS